MPPYDHDINNARAEVVTDTEAQIQRMKVVAPLNKSITPRPYTPQHPDNIKATDLSPVDENTQPHNPTAHTTANTNHHVLDKLLRKKTQRGALAPIREVEVEKVTYRTTFTTGNASSSPPSQQEYLKQFWEASPILAGKPVPQLGRK